MKKTKEMYSGGFYLLRGQSSANSSFIEDKEEAIRFIAECNKRLAGFARIHDYLLTKDGWVLVISLYDEKTIKKNYRSNWEKSSRVKKESYLKEVWKIISEQIRQIRFTFVLYSNRKNGREGSKVKRSYERFWFESLEEATGYLSKMRNQLIKMCQELKTYHSKRRHFRISEGEAKGAVFLCSMQYGEGACDEYFGRGCMDIIGERIDVLRSLIKTTIQLHIDTKTTPFSPKLE